MTESALQAVADRWAERLMNLIKANGHLYLLLNRFNGLDERLVLLVNPLPEQWPLTDPYFGEAIERTPLLVKLTMAQLPLLDQAALVAAEAALDPAMPASPVYAWMCADVSTERLAGQLRRQLDIRVEGRKKSAFFRYFDPRLMSHLPRVLTAAQFARLLGAVSLWVVPSRKGELLESRWVGSSCSRGCSGRLVRGWGRFMTLRTCRRLASERSICWSSRSARAQWPKGHSQSLAQ